MNEILTNIRITNKAVLPINTNLKTINGINLINNCDDCTDIGVTFAFVFGTILVDTTLPYVDNTHYIYLVDNAIVTIPTAIGCTSLYTIKDNGGGNATITFTGGETGDGVPSITLSFDEALTFFSDGTNYKII